MIYRRLSFLSALAAILLMAGCASEECFHSKGTVTVAERSIADVIDTVVLRGEMNLYITQDYKNRLLLKGGSKVLPWISTTVKGKTLTITDENECPFLRDMDFVADVYLTVTDLKFLSVLSSGKITTKGVLKTETLAVEYLDGAGYVDLNVNAVDFRYQVINGASEAHLSGEVRNFSLYGDGFGPVDASSLPASYLFVYHMGSNLMKVRSVDGGSLNVEIHSNGNVGYYGSPANISLIQDGDGRLVHY